MPTRRGRWIVAGLAVLVIASLWRMVWLEQQQKRLSGAYEAARLTFHGLQDEQQALSDELGRARKALIAKAKDAKIAQEELEADLALVQVELDETVAELASLHREHESLRSAHGSLAEQVDALSLEKVALEHRLTSIPALRDAIRNIRHKMREERWVSWRERIRKLKEDDQRQLAKGNQGFVVRQGHSTIGSGTALRIHVHEPEAAD